MFRNAKYCITSISVPLLFAGAAFSQPLASVADPGEPAGAVISATATLFGVTKSPQGGPLAGARVVVRNLDDGVERVLITDESGVFSATDLKPGRYQLMANKDRLVSPPKIVWHSWRTRRCGTISR